MAQDSTGPAARGAHGQSGRGRAHVARDARSGGGGGGGGGSGDGGGESHAKRRHDSLGSDGDSGPATHTSGSKRARLQRD